MDDLEQSRLAQDRTSQGLPGGASGKQPACQCRIRKCSISGSGRSPGEGNGNPLQYSCLEKSHGQRSLAGYTPWDCKELDTIEATLYSGQLKLATCTLGPPSDLVKIF